MINIACAVFAIILYAIFFAVATLTHNGSLYFIGFFITLIVYAFISNIVDHWVGYMFKYGSIHAIMRAYTTGAVSENYFNDSVEYIKSGFIKANVYFVIDKLVNAAVRGVTKLVNFITGFLPDNIKNFIDIFINMYLDCIDECCLAYSMIRADENVAKTSCDGVVLYFQNAKNMLKPAFKTTVRIFLTRAAVTLITLILLFQPLLALAFCLVAFSVINPFLHHRVLCETITSYLGYALSDNVRTDIYGKLSEVKPFKKLMDKCADPEFEPAPGNPSYAASAARTQATAQNIPKPQMNTIPEPDVPRMSDEQIMWQQAWEKMSPNQKQMYVNMGPSEQLAWKKQILKALYNYDMQ